MPNSKLDSIRTQVGEALLSRMIANFAGRAEEMTRSLRAAHEAGDLIRLEHHAHKIVSAAGALGGEQVSKLGKWVQDHAIRGQHEELSRAVPAMIEAIQVFTTELTEAEGTRRRQNAHP